MFWWSCSRVSTFSSFSVFLFDHSFLSNSNTQETKLYTMAKLHLAIVCAFALFFGFCCTASIANESITEVENADDLTDADIQELLLYAGIADELATDDLLLEDPSMPVKRNSEILNSLIGLPNKLRMKGKRNSEILNSLIGLPNKLRMKGKRNSEILNSLIGLPNKLRMKGKRNSEILNSLIGLPNKLRLKGKRNSEIANLLLGLPTNLRLKGR